MKYILKDTLDAYLRANYSYEEFYAATKHVCKTIEISDPGEIRYVDVIDLPSIKKYFAVMILFKHLNNRRYYKILEIIELSLDEYIKERLKGDQEFKSYVKELSIIL
jgi:hypothetical protein